MGFRKGGSGVAESYQERTRPVKTGSDRGQGRRDGAALRHPLALLLTVRGQGTISAATPKHGRPSHFVRL